MFDSVKMVLRGEEIEVPGNRVTLIRPARQLYRIEWQPIPSEDGIAALYSKRWEGSPTSLQSHIERLTRSLEREEDGREVLELGQQFEHYIALQDLLSAAEEVEVISNG
jgi:hypothetical protein